MTRLIVWCHAHAIPSWLLAQAAALLGAMWVLRWGLRRRALGHREVVFALGVGAGVVLFAALLGPILRLPRAFLRGDALFSAGWVMAYGAIGGACLGAYVTARMTQEDPLKVLDALAPALGVLVFLGRFGCLLAGCDFGRASHVAWAVAYPQGTPAFLENASRGTIDVHASLSPELHPTQLYEMGLGALMILWSLRARRRGAPILGALGLYAIGRYLVELLRDDSRPMVKLGTFELSLAQCMSVATLGFVAYVWVARSRDEPAGDDQSGRSMGS